MIIIIIIECELENVKFGGKIHPGECVCLFVCLLFFHLVNGIKQQPESSIFCLNRHGIQSEMISEKEKCFLYFCSLIKNQQQQQQQQHKNNNK